VEGENFGRKDVILASCASTEFLESRGEWEWADFFRTYLNGGRQILDGLGNRRQQKIEKGRSPERKLG